VVKNRMVVVGSLLAIALTIAVPRVEAQDIGAAQSALRVTATKFGDLGKGSSEQEIRDKSFRVVRCAAFVLAQSTDPGWGLLRKPDGSNSSGFASDILFHRGSAHIFDVIGDSDGPRAGLSWDDKGAMDLARWAAASGEGCTTDSGSGGSGSGSGSGGGSTPPPSDTATADLQRQEIDILKQIVASLAAQNEALVKGLSDLKATVAAGVKIRF
jgi:hypothetical protein